MCPFISCLQNNRCEPFYNNNQSAMKILERERERKRMIERVNKRVVLAFLFSEACNPLKDYLLRTTYPILLASKYTLNLFHNCRSTFFLHR